MLDIVGTGRLLQLLPEGSYVLGKSIVIQIADPVVSASGRGGAFLLGSIPRRRRPRRLDRDRNGLGGAARDDVGARRRPWRSEGTGQSCQDEEEGGSSSVAEGHHGRLGVEKRCQVLL